ncbi:hypothetical protein ALI144C_07890 [Actinosynnema sp. ALI-1.44]|nr:hypothetical protein ALI144C_07890 [Actinosynnema sp. ALI-1.44]
MVYEGDLADAHGFVTAYQRSKYEAEVLVHRWSRVHQRPVVIFRPTVLVTDRPPHPAMPAHTFRSSPTC